MIVIVESPFHENKEHTREEHVTYARACLLDSLNRGECPLASHLLYPQVLDDDIPDQRRQGIDCQLDTIAIADVVAVYLDMGLSSGMKEAVTFASERGIKVEFRSVESYDG